MTSITRNLLLAIAVLGLAACDSSLNDDSSNTELAQLGAFVSDEIALSDDQEREFTASLNRHGGKGDREPGFLWRVAEEAQGNWTDEQKAELFARTEDLEDGLSFRGLLGHPGSGGFYGLGGFFGGSRRHGVSPDDDVLNLTADQEAAFEELHTRYREQFKTLVESFQNGDVTEDDFAAQMIALRTDKAAEVADILTDEQEAALEAHRTARQAEFEAFKEEVKAVRNEVLGLSDQQAEAIDALYAEQLESRESLVEQLQAGTISVVDLQAEIVALEDARREVLEGLLDATQYEIVQIHDALSVRSGRMGHRGGRHGGGFGRGNGHGHTFGG